MVQDNLVAPSDGVLFQEMRQNKDLLYLKNQEDIHLLGEIMDVAIWLLKVTAMEFIAMDHAVISDLLVTLRLQLPPYPQLFRRNLVLHHQLRCPHHQQDCRLYIPL